MSACKGSSRKIAGLVLGGLLALSGTSAQATGGFGGIVYDPTNHVENIATALQTAQQYALDLRRFEAEFRAMMNLDQYLGNSLLALNDYQALVNDVNALSNRLRDADRFLTDLHRDLAVSPAQNWEDYHRLRRTQAEAGQAHAEARFRHAADIMNGVDDQYERMREAERRVPQIEGTREGFQQLSAQMSMVTRQNAQMLELVSSQTMAESEEIAIDEMLWQQRKAELEARVMETDRARREAHEAANAYWRSIGINIDR